MHWVKNMVVLICGMSLISACDENRRMIEPFVPTGNRVVLLEEFTGKGCTQCPKGAREIENLLTLFPDNLIAVSIHAGPFANPASYPQLGPNDLRSPQAQELFDLLSPVLFYPTGAVNRTPVGGDMQLTLNQWASAISSHLQTPPAVELSIEKNYNPSTRDLEVTVTGIAKENLTGNFNLSIMLTESGIVDPQDDIEAGGIVPDYVHRHVLRDMMTPAAGVSLFSSLTTGESFSYTSSIQLPAGWVAENMEIVAFVTNMQGSTFPVLQAVSGHVTD